MATITIKIESEQLAREVLTQLGCLPDLISIESKDEEPKPVVHLVNLPESTRNTPVQKRGEFCVEPDSKDIGASLDVYSDDAKKEQDDLYKQYIEVRKALPSAEELRKEKAASAEELLKKTADKLIGGELMDYLNDMCVHPDKYMSEAAKAYLSSMN